MSEFGLCIGVFGKAADMLVNVGTQRSRSGNVSANLSTNRNIWIGTNVQYSGIPLLIITNSAGAIKIGIGRIPSGNPDVFAPALDATAYTLSGQGLVGAVNGGYVWGGIAKTNQVSGNWTATNNIYATNNGYIGGTLTASNVVLSTAKWTDAPYQFFWGATGPTPPDATPVISGSGISGMGFTVAGEGTQKVYASCQFGHGMAPSNSTLYVEPHIHVSPTTAPTAGSSNIAFTIIFDLMSVNGTRYGPVTNVQQIGLTANTFNNLIEFGHVTNSTFYPGISGISRATIYRSAASSNEFNASVILDAADIHYPVDRFGSTTDSAP